MSKRRNMLTGGNPPGDGAPPSDAGSTGPDASNEAGSASSAPSGVRGTRVRASVDPERDLVCCRLPLTDMGVAERWRARFGHDFRFCAEIGWFAWDGKRWKLLSEEKDSVPAQVVWSLMITVRAIRNEASLVAASGWFFDRSYTEAVEDRITLWASETCNEGTERYEREIKRAFPEREADWLEWLRKLDAMDYPVDTTKRVMWSDRVAGFAKTAENGAQIGRALKWIKGLPDVVVTPSAFDADRMAINVDNGTLRFVRERVQRSAEEQAAGKSKWKTGGWKCVRTPHTREDLITKLAPVRYLPRSACPEYDAFIARMQPDETMRRFIHQWGGYSLTGDTGEQKLAFFYGSGRNGKGTWVETVAAIAGDYAGSIPIESFLDNGGKRRGDQATPDIARLPGVRFLRVSEPEKGAALNEGLVKMVTGQDPVDARHLNKGFFTFLPDFKMTISGNHKPKIKDTSDGIWRRMQLVPWSIQIPREDVDRALGGKLREEASGVLNRLIEGLLDWLQHGLVEPDAVRAATAAYRDDSDLLGRFLTACCEVASGEDAKKVRVKATELFELFDAWCQASGIEAWKRNGFVNAMRDKGFEQLTSNGVWWVRVQPRASVTVDALKSGSWSGPDDDGPWEEYDARDPFDPEDGYDG